MVTCPNCGEENRKEALYCRKCGERLQSSVYVKRREPWGIVHIGVLLIAVLLLIISFGLIMGGTSLRSIQSIMTDDEGFIMSNTKQLQVFSYAIVVEDMDFDIDPIALRWFETQGGFFRFKIITESNNPEKEIFIGVARYEDAYSYVNPMEYHEITNFDMGWENFGTRTTHIDYILHQGDAPTAPPTVHSYWIVHGADAGEQALTWEPEAGRYYLVMMNSDGSAGINADVRIGVEIPFFAGIGNILLVAGVFIGAIGVLMLYFTIRRNQS
jgi:hypothetical protein